MALMICPTDPTHTTFVTTAHEVHDWVVDADGEFIEDLGCIEVSHNPDTGNIWGCRTCGADAVRPGEGVPRHDFQVFFR